MTGEQAAQETWGYTDRANVVAGDSVQVMVSSTAPRLSASVVRLERLDLGGVDLGGDVRHVSEPVEAIAARPLPGARQELVAGSYASIDLGRPGIDVAAGATFSCWLRPTVLGSGTRTVLSTRVAPSGAALVLGLEPGAGLFVAVGDWRLATEVELLEDEWCFVAVSLDARRRTVRLRQSPARTRGVAVEAVYDASLGALEGWLHLGARLDGGSVGRPTGVLNGKLDEPSLFVPVLDGAELDALASGADPTTVGSPAGVWSFVPSQPTGAATDRSGGGRHGVLVNLPTTGVPGWRWRGAGLSWRTSPREFGAVAFHDDDLEDAGWPVATEIALPASLQSGIYAVRLVADDGSTDEVPFFVRPRRPSSDVLFLCPTFTYLAYADEHWTWCNPAVELPYDAGALLSSADHYAARNALLSLYDHHSDDTGVCYASWRRPLVTMRPSYLSAAVRGRRELSADLFITNWLAERSVDYDVATDWDLHDGGAALLDRYRVVITGSHPEYCSGEMLDALDAYVGHGGRLMYLGGNGFYWVTTVDPAKPYLIEVRRGHAGSGTWRSAPGEVTHSQTGEPGGLWRHRGRAPQQLAGVGMTAIGLGPGRPYRRSPASFSPEHAWIFEGVGDEPIGDHGYVLGAAAGLEIDCADRALGTPPGAVVLATADGFDDSYQGVVEDVIESNSLQGGSVCARVRADLTYFGSPGEGAVFSVGSITWSGALAWDHHRNAAATVTTNVLAAFVAPEPPGSTVAGEDGVVTSPAAASGAPVGDQGAR